jgi:tetratricopeptide (TPR) repeat protein
VRTLDRSAEALRYHYLWRRALALRALGGLAIVLWSAAVAAAQPGSSNAEILAEARALVDAGQPAVAIEKLQRLDARDDPLVAELLGVAYYHANDPAKAIDTLTPVVARLDAASLAGREAVQVLGLSHFLAGHLAESIPYLEQTRTLVPDDIKLAYTLGMAYAQTRQPAKARDSFARTFRIAPESPGAYLLAGQMLNRLELEDLAEAELQRAIKMDPKLPEAHYILAQIAIFRSRLDEALSLLRDELAINPAHAMALYRVGEVYSRQLKWDAAIAALQQSLWINPYFSGPYILLGKAYNKTGQQAAAEEMLRRAIEYDPNNKSAHYLLAQLLQQTGRLEEAKREFAIAERLHGDVK